MAEEWVAGGVVLVDEFAQKRRCFSSSRSDEGGL